MKLATVWRAMWQAHLTWPRYRDNNNIPMCVKRHRQDIKFSAYIYKRLKEIDDDPQR